MRGFIYIICMRGVTNLQHACERVIRVTVVVCVCVSLT